jgi:hypothetical protein
MPKVPIPPDADINIRRALENIENRLTALEKPKPAAVIVPEKKVEVVSDLTTLKNVQINGDLRVENELDVLGAVDAPHLHEGLIEVVPSGEAGTSTAQRTLNVKGSVVIAPGGLSTHSIHARKWYGLLEPRGIGLFDKYGNAIQTCQLACVPFPYACTARSLHVWLEDGTSVDVNAHKNGSSQMLASDLQTTSTGAWVTSGALQNNTFAPGDWLEIEWAAVSGTVTHSVVVVYFERV